MPAGRVSIFLITRQKRKEMKKSIPAEALELKRKLYNRCLEMVNQRIEMIAHAMENARQAANEEEKSSAGDKYETTRSMMHLDMERYSGQMAEAVKVKQELAQIEVGKLYQAVQPGSLVRTSQGNYFLAVSAGKIQLDQADYFAVSAASPIGSKLKGLKAGEAFLFNNKQLKIKEVL